MSKREWPGIATRTFGVLVGLWGIAGVLRADVNVAPGGTATQSTTAFDGFPERANDGNTDGNYGGGSVSHTDPGDIAPFWQVELAQTYQISRVVLWNRTDCCSERLTNFRISILDESSLEVEGDDFFTDLSFPSPSFEWLLSSPVDGKTVRVERLGPDTGGNTLLSMAEVEVYSDAANIAPVILTQPRGGKGFVGKSFTFSVTASGSEPLTYTWKRGATQVGGNSPDLTLSNLTPGDAGDYTVEVSNGVGPAVSDPVPLRVYAGRNLARDGEASQSSTGYGGSPSRAIDGNTSGAWGDNTITHTNDGDPAPAWEVVLFGPSTIDAIFVWNRLDCCSDRLNNVKVSVLDVDRNEIWSDVYFTEVDVGAAPVQDPNLGIELDTFPAGTGGQIVRLEHLEPLNGSPLYLSLSEVEVIGTGPVPPPDPNLCRREGVTATQSSEYNGGQFPAGNAINGSLDDFTHTGAGLNLPSTWEVNLGAENDIEEIVIWNRSSCCGSRLRDITVSIWNLAGDTLLFESDLLNPENEQGAFPDGPQKLSVNVFEIKGSFVKGGRVRVVREPDDDLSGTGGQGNPDEMDVLALAEVQVFTPVECPAAGDTHCVSNFFRIKAPDAGGAGVYQLSAAGRDDSGDAVKYTFTATNGRDPPIVIGPQASSVASVLLGVQNWTVSVTVDDNLRCDDIANDATCSKELVVEGKPNNKAPFGSATQSTIGFGGVPNRAIDGVTSGNYGDNSITHTEDGDPTPWWELELDKTYPIENIVFWNRTDCCSERLTNFRVSLLAADRSEVYAEDLFTDLTFPDTTVEGYDYPVGGLSAKIVRVELLVPGGSHLSLAEVEVFCSTGPVESNCSNGADDDSDGFTDCADSDCSRSPSCGGGSFHRGDADDNGQLQLTDAVRVLGFLFLGQAAPTCLDAADADDNGQVQLTDAVRILGFLFLGQAPPSPPGPPDQPCGVDPTAEAPDLGCETYSACN